MSSTNDPKYDRGVKKLFGAYTEEDDDGERLLKNEDLENLLQDFEICPQLAEWEEVAEALHATVQPDREGMNFHEFKKFLRKVAVNEFKKKKYEHRFPSHDQRHNALLQYLRADDVDALLERARECQMMQRSSEDAGHASLSPDNSRAPSRSKKSSSGKKDKKSSSKHHRSATEGHENVDVEAHGSDSKRGPQAVQETVEERIRRKQEEALSAKRQQRKEEEDARRQAVEDVRIEYGQEDAPRSSNSVRPQSAASEGSTISRPSRPESAASRPESAARGRSGGISSGGDRLEASMWGVEDGSAALNSSGLRGIDEDKSGWSGGWADVDDDGQGPEYAAREHVLLDGPDIARGNDASISARRDGGDAPRRQGNDDLDDDDDILIQEDDDEGDSCDEKMDAILGSNGVVGLAHRDREAEDGALTGHHHRDGSPRLTDTDDPAALAPRSRPQSSRPPSAGRHLRPESARPNRDKLGSPAPGGVGGGGGNAPPPEQVSFDIDCNYGTATGTAHVEERASWQDVCSSIRRLFGMPAAAPVLLTYKIRENGGGGRQEACSSHSDFVRMAAYVAKYHPAQGALKAQVLMMQEDASLSEAADRNERQGNSLSSGLMWQDASLLGRPDEDDDILDAADLSHGLVSEHSAVGGEGPIGGSGERAGREASSSGAHRPASAGSAPPDTSDRVEYVPGAGLSELVSPRDGKRPPAVGGDAVRPHSSTRPLSASTRPVSATSRPVSAPRATRSADGGCPQGPVLQPGPSSAGEAPSRDLAIRNAGGGLSRGALEDDASSIKDNVAARGGAGAGGAGGEVPKKLRGTSAPLAVGPPGGGKPAVGEQMSVSSKSLAERSALPGASASLSWQQKLLSCIKLGVLPASAQLIVQVEYCTWKGRDRSLTLSGSTKKYKDYYQQLDEEVKRAMPEWDIRVEQSRDKPRIGAFEITLAWRHNSFAYKVLLYSKLSHPRGWWPNVKERVANLCHVLPRPSEQVAVKVLNNHTQFAIPDAHIVIQDPDTGDVLHRRAGWGWRTIVRAIGSGLSDGDGVASIVAKEGMYDVTVSAEGYKMEASLQTLSSNHPLTIRLTVAGAEGMHSLSASNPSLSVGSVSDDRFDDRAS